MKKKTANSSIGGDSCVCLPQAHLPATFASRIRRAQPTNFKSTRQYRSHWERHLWMACCFASHAAAAATRSEHWLTDWAHTAALQYFRSFFVCRLSIPILLSLTLAFQTDAQPYWIRSERTHAKTLRTHTWNECTHAIHQSPIQRCAHTHTQQARRVHQFSCAKRQTYVCINFYFVHIVLFRLSLSYTSNVVDGDGCVVMWFAESNILRKSIKFQTEEKKFCASRFGVLRECLRVFLLAAKQNGNTDQLRQK